MKLCTHTICRYAASDKLLREALAARRDGEYRQSDALALEARDVHTQPVACRMEEPEKPPPANLKLDLKPRDPQFQRVKAAHA